MKGFLYPPIHFWWWWGRRLWHRLYVNLSWFPCVMWVTSGLLLYRSWWWWAKAWSTLMHTSVVPVPATRTSTMRSNGGTWLMLFRMSIWLFSMSVHLCCMAVWPLHKTLCHAYSKKIYCYRMYGFDEKATFTLNKFKQVLWCWFHVYHNLSLLVSSP